MRKENLILHNEIIEELKEAIANIEEVESFSINKIVKQPLYTVYAINIISKDNIKHETKVTIDSSAISACEKDLSAWIKFITRHIQNRLEIKRKTLKKEREINKALEQ